MPKITPMVAENRKASRAAATEIDTLQPASHAINAVMSQPKAMPSRPPTALTTTASTRNCDRMSPARAPTALRRPISRVRSVTDTSMMFMMPMPPTSSEMAAIDASRKLIVWLDSASAAWISARLRIWKASCCCDGGTLWRRMIASPIATCASGISSGLRTSMST